MLFVKEDTGRVVVRPSEAYPAYLTVIGHKGPVTQGALETARLVLTEDLCRVIGKPLHIYIEREDGKFALRNFPVGEPPRGAIGTWYESLPGTPVTRLGIKLN